LSNPLALLSSVKFLLRRASLRPILARPLAWVLATTLAVAGCAAPPPLPRPPAGYAQAPQADSPFAPLESRIVAGHGGSASGFRLLSRNEDALLWRLALIDSARDSLDLQYYVWFGDKVGQLMMARVIAAANRGVRVRLLFDDLNTLLHDMTSVELRDAALATIDRHPSIELRVFNAWRHRDLLGRAGEAVAEFGRLNRRMHNKQMIVDNRVAIIGGRNIGDEYFGLNSGFNFHDLDVLGVGPVARQASSVFDRYWNSDWVRRIPLGGATVEPPTRSAAEAGALAMLEADARAHLLHDGKQEWTGKLTELGGSLHAGRSTVHTDSPSRAANVHNFVPEAFRGLLRSARSEVLITNAYIIPDRNFIADLRALAARGVRIRILTNSLASHDVPAVNSHYERWRREILQTGAQLYEFRADPAIKASVVEFPPFAGDFAGLHTKAMVIDRRRSFVGSMNLDPRSEVINAEMGIAIDSEPLAAALAAEMERDMGPANSWSVTLDADGRLRWSDDRRTRATQPARNFAQRIQNLFFKLFPPSLY
jgi:putative cardiolipin synthase